MSDLSKMSDAERTASILPQVAATTGSADHIAHTKAQWRDVALTLATKAFTIAEASSHG